MFKVGTRIVHKDSPNTFAKSWEVMSIADDEVMLGGPGNFETCKGIPVSEQWDWVALVLDTARTGGAS